jgi:hypothetical protein
MANTVFIPLDCATTSACLWKTAARDNPALALLFSRAMQTAAKQPKVVGQKKSYS